MCSLSDFLIEKRNKKNGSEFHFFFLFLYIFEVNGYAGDPIPTPRFVPIDTLKIPDRAEDFESCLTALRWCDKLCTKYETQQGLVKHWFFLKVALCEHVFTKVVSVSLRPIN